MPQSRIKRYVGSPTPRPGVVGAGVAVFGIVMAACGGSAISAAQRRCGVREAQD